MLKTRTKIFLFLLCGLLLIGCSKGDEANKDNESYYRFVDDAGFEIVLNEKPKKVGPFPEGRLRLQYRKVSIEDLLQAKCF